MEISRHNDHRDRQPRSGLRLPDRPLGEWILQLSEYSSLLKGDENTPVTALWIPVIRQSNLGHLQNIHEIVATLLADDPGCRDTVRESLTVLGKAHKNQWERSSREKKEKRRVWQELGCPSLECALRYFQMAEKLDPGDLPSMLEYLYIAYSLRSYSFGVDIEDEKQSTALIFEHLFNVPPLGARTLERNFGITRKDLENPDFSRPRGSESLLSPLSIFSHASRACTRIACIIYQSQEPEALVQYYVEEARQFARTGLGLFPALAQHGYRLNGTLRETVTGEPQSEQNDIARLLKVLLNCLGTSAGMAGQIERAKNAFEAVLAFDPSDISAKNNLQRIESGNEEPFGISSGVPPQQPGVLSRLHQSTREQFGEKGEISAETPQEAFLAAVRNFDALPGSSGEHELAAEAEVLVRFILGKKGGDPDAEFASLQEAVSFLPRSFPPSEISQLLYSYRTLREITENIELVTRIIFGDSVQMSNKGLFPRSEYLNRVIEDALTLLGDEDMIPDEDLQYAAEACLEEFF